MIVKFFNKSNYGHRNRIGFYCPMIPFEK